MTQQWRPQCPPGQGGRPDRQPVPPTPDWVTDPMSQATPPRPPRPEPSGDRWAAPTQGATEAQRAPLDRRRLLVPLAIALACLLAIGAGAWWWFVGRPQVDPNTQVSASSRPARAVPVAKPDEVVRRYLQALADGRIAEAIAYGPVGPGSQALLTDEVAAASKGFAPITDIAVSASGDAPTAVTARYRLGGEPVTADIRVQRQQDGTWQLATSTLTLQLNAKRSDGVPVLINGQNVEAQQVEVVPGMYLISTGLPFIDYEQGTQVRVTTLDSRVEVPRLTTVITAEGQQAMLDAGRASLDACLASTALEPAGCPFGGRLPGTVDGGVRWTLASDPWRDFAPSLQPASHEAIARMVVSTDVSFALAGGSRSQQNVRNDVELSSDLAVRNASDVKVVWRRL